MTISIEELQLAARNHGMPLEPLRYPVTPIGLHYLLIHFGVPEPSPGWRLEVAGSVSRPLSLSLDDLRSRPHVRMPVTMECAGNGRARLEPHVVSQPWLAEAVGTGEWGGTPLRGLREEVEPLEEAVEVVFSGLDRGIDGDVEQAYERSLPLADALGGDGLVAYELNGEPLPRQHGFPLRLVVPGWYGMASVKWLARIEISERPFEGVDAGEHVLEGRAWSGFGPVASVEVSVEGGASWRPAELEPPAGRWAWVGWRVGWRAEPGEHELSCRARDEAGNEQPLEPTWNVGGYVNNAVQRIPVTVR